MRSIQIISTLSGSLFLLIVANSALASSGAKYQFGRLFPQLTSNTTSIAVLRQLGAPSNDTSSPAYMEDSQFRGTDNNADIEVGQTYTGQILAHDISLDLTSVLGETIEPKKIRNNATPWIDLDTIYGSRENKAARDPNNRAKLLLGNNIGNERDYARDANGHAIIVDRRNDENNNLAQLAPVLIKFHNTMVDELTVSGLTNQRRLFKKAKKLTIAHWQSIILYDYLPNFVDQTLIDDILNNGRRFYKNKMAKKGIIPVEFAMAAHRFGHSIVRGRYTLNSNFERMRLFPLSAAELTRNLLGGVPIPSERQIGWSRFFKINGSVPGDINDPVDQFSGLQVGRVIDRLVARPMLRLPFGGPGLPDFVLDTENTVAGMPTISLAALSLLRGSATGLPSGQAVANAMGIEPPLENVQFDICDSGLVTDNCEIFLQESIETPLFIYITEEARIQNGGAKLGEVGGRIVAEVILGLLQHDKKSILRQNFVSHISGQKQFSMAEMITHIGWETTPYDDGIGNN